MPDEITYSHVFRWSIGARPDMFFNSRKTLETILDKEYGWAKVAIHKMGPDNYLYLGRQYVFGRDTIEDKWIELGTYSRRD